MRKDVRDLLDELTQQGWRTDPGKSGKVICRSPDGVTIVVIHGTPSDHRWRQNAVSQLKKGGYRPKK
jgi:hypothetical protein